MLGSFRMRLFLVLVVVALVLTGLNSGNQSRERVEPVLEYIMKTDYQVDDRLFSLLDSRSVEERFRPVPTSAPGGVEPPCEAGKIKRHFGWYWNPDSQRQEFNPGVVLQLPENSPVRAVLGGEVEEITGAPEGGRKVRIRHGEEMVSVYSGLKEVFVSRGEVVRSGDILGKSRRELYFELRNQDRTLNPEKLFE
ncbi:MAG: M23 family metallopeptidase [Syntrophomonadaceae bacterium]|nr:M23 family metallopeptidase [Syntrophomonadaceae bacterium]